jgi:hypothetical protein
MTVRSFAAALGLLVLSACATITPDDTQPLLTSATALRTSLHTEAGAVDTAFQTISDSTDAICAHPRLGSEFRTWCDEWKPPAANANPGAHRATTDTARKSLASAADEGMDQIVAYTQAVHAMAQAGQQSAAAADSVNRRLTALSGLLGGADGPLGFVTGEVFGTALKALAQAQAAYQVRQTLRAATRQAQLTLDLYAIAMRNTLGACSVVPPPALIARVRAALPAAMIHLPNGATLRDQALAALDKTGHDEDPCHQGSYLTVTSDEGDALLIAEQFRTSFSFAALHGIGDQLGENTDNLNDILADLDAAGAFSGGARTPAQQHRINSLLTRLRALREAQSMAAPYQTQVDTLATREQAARRFARDRAEGGQRLARAFFAFAQEHQEFAEAVNKRRGFDLSTLLGGAGGGDQTPATTPPATAPTPAPTSGGH